MEERVSICRTAIERKVEPLIRIVLRRNVFLGLSSLPLSAVILLFVFIDLASAGAQTADDSMEDLWAFDETPAMIRITDPASCSNSIMSPGIVVVRGVADDDLSGVKKVEGFSHTYPFNDQYDFVMATPVQADWSSWSIPVEIHETATRILVRVTDNAGNENWDEVIIDIQEMKQKHDSRDSSRAVAFVEPSFTAAAYNLDGFYEFYDKYKDVDFGEDVTGDLHLMTADIPAAPDKAYFEPILKRVKDFLPAEVKTPIIGDTDVHDGFVFRNDGSNAYEALFLLHNEYVTQQEYDNLRSFVSNGGKVVYLDGNLFYGEVSYDKTYCTATLIKGHNWEFDGKVVKRSVSERYFDENREFLGSNYMINSLGDPVYFTNNPFNYTHFEENYVTNPNAKILHDYGLTIGDGYEADDWHRNATIATYELAYGKGKNIVLGIYAQNESDNPAFLDFFEKVVLMRALGIEHKVEAGDREYSIFWKMESGSVSQVAADSVLAKLTLDIDRRENVSDVLQISLPKELIDVSDLPIESNGSNIDADQDSESITMPLPNQRQETNAMQARMNQLVVTTFNGKDIVLDRMGVDHLSTEYERIIEIPLSKDVSTVEIYGAYVAPEFGLPEILFILSAACIACSLGFTMIYTARIRAPGRL